MVTIIDDTGRRNCTHVVTTEMREQYFLIHSIHMLANIKKVLARNKCGHVIQEVDPIEHTFEGRYLELSIKRAKRWMRNQEGSPPKHIALAMAAFHKVDPEAFKKLMN